MYKRNKNQKYITRFKSHTDINNYNNFLLKLDKKQLYCNSAIFDKIKQTNVSSDKQNMDEILKNIKDSFINHNIIVPNISGLDPNLYEPSSNESSNEKIQVTKNENEEDKIKGKPVNKVIINVEINNISDLLLLIETYPLDKNTEYNINMDALHKIKQPLNELNNMIGMKKLSH